MARMTPQPKVVLPVRLLIVRLWRLDRRRQPRRPRLQFLRGRRAARVGLLHPTDVWASLASLLDPDDVPSRVSRGSGRHPSSDTGECPARRERARRCPSTYRRCAEAQASSTSSPWTAVAGWTCSCPALGRCAHVHGPTMRDSLQTEVWPREESNLRARIRSPSLYPLSYGARLTREGGGWDSNPRPPGPQPGALPTELPPPWTAQDSGVSSGVPPTPKSRGG